MSSGGLGWLELTWGGNRYHHVATDLTGRSPRFPEVLRPLSLLVQPLFGRYSFHDSLLCRFSQLVRGKEANPQNETARLMVLSRRPAGTGLNSLYRCPLPIVLTTVLYEVHGSSCKTFCHIPSFSLKPIINRHRFRGPFSDTKSVSEATGLTPTQITTVALRAIFTTRLVSICIEPERRIPDTQEAPVEASGPPTLFAR